VLRSELPIPITRQGIGLLLCEVYALVAGPERRDAAFNLRGPRGVFGHCLVRWSVGGPVEFFFPRWPVENLIFASHILGSRMRSLKVPDLASGFNVMLHREPICVLALCIDQTSKALQIQQVVAAIREIACVLVRSRGLEPPRVAPLAPQASASTSSATTASERHRAPGKGEGVRQRAACNKSAMLVQERRDLGLTGRRPSRLRCLRATMGRRYLAND
jgi:hypothetical protein